MDPQVRRLVITTLFSTVIQVESNTQEICAIKSTNWPK